MGDEDVNGNVCRWRRKKFPTGRCQNRTVRGELISTRMTYIDTEITLKMFALGRITPIDMHFIEYTAKYFF